MNKMDRLPIELSVIIFDHLDLVDLMALRLVCKKFEQTVKRVKIRELVFLNAREFWTSSAYETNKSWIPMNAAKELGAIFNFSKYLLSSSPLSGGPFDVRSLKRLSIRSLREVKGIDFEDLNRFGQLEQLEIGFDQRPRQTSSMWSLFDQQKRKVPHLFLPNLKALHIVSYFNQHGLMIDAPRLKALKLPKLLKASDEREHYASYDAERMQDAQRNFACFLNRSTNDLSSLRFEHPGSVELLQVPDLCAYSDSYDLELIALDPGEFRGSEFDYFRYLNYIERFRNVEHLFLDQFFRANEFHGNVTGYLGSVIFKMPNLKRLNLHSDRPVPFDSFRIPEFTRLLQWVAIRRPELTVCHMGFEFSNGRNRLLDRLFDDFSSFQDACAQEVGKERERPNPLYSLIYSDSECLHWISSYHLALHLKNSSLVDKSRPSDAEIIYHKLMHVIQTMQVSEIPELGEATTRNGLMNLLPDVFFEMKITLIRATNRVENEEDFTRLVKSCRSLKQLNLKLSELSQAFFDGLPEICLLNALHIVERKQLDLHFLFRMNQLVHCRTNQRMSHELVLKLVKRKYCRSLSFRKKSRYRAIIHRSGRDQFRYASIHWAVPYDSYCSLVNSDSSYRVLSFESLAEHLDRPENFRQGFRTIFAFFPYQMKYDFFWFLVKIDRAQRAFQIYTGFSNLTVSLNLFCLHYLHSKLLRNTIGRAFHSFPQLTFAFYSTDLLPHFHYNLCADDDSFHLFATS